MDTLDEGQSLETEHVATPEVEEGGGEAPGEATVSPEIEAKAREMGWRPQEEFHGNPDDWRDADEFVRRGEDFLPIVRSRLEKSEAKLQDYETRFQQLDQQRQEDFERLSRMNDISRQRERERIEREYEEAGRKAVEFADPEEYDRIQARKKEDLKAFDEAAAPPEPKKKEEELEQKVDPDVRSFLTQNGHWFGDNGNKSMTLRAMAELEDIEAEHPAMSMADKLSEMKRRTVQKYPKAFGVKPTGGTPDVLGGSRRGTSQGDGQHAKRLPPEARKQAEKEIAEGNFKSIEEYAKIYFEAEA